MVSKETVKVLKSVLGISGKKIREMFKDPIIPKALTLEEAGEILDNTIPGTKKEKAAALQYQKFLEKEQPSEE